MKPIGFKKLYKEEWYSDIMPSKKIKSYKRGEKQQVKRDLYKELNSGIEEMKEKRIADGLKQGLLEAIESELKEKVKCTDPVCFFNDPKNAMFCVKCLNVITV